MSEIDVDMAVHAIEQGVADILAAARDGEGRAFVDANRERLLAEMRRLGEELARLREPVGVVGLRMSAIAPPRQRPATPAAQAAFRRTKTGGRASARTHAG